MINPMIMNACEIAVSKNKHPQQQKKTNLSKFGERIQRQLNPDQQSYFAADPKTYLGIQYKNNYIEVVQHLMLSSPEGKISQ